MPEENINRKSVIRKVITRKYNTAKYETMDITVDHQHEIEWDSISTLKAKSNNLTTLVVQDFDDTARKVMDELRVTTFAATMTTSSDANKRALSAQEKQDFDKLG
jgi:hypothetical protein